LHNFAIAFAAKASVKLLGIKMLAMIWGYEGTF
jgi:hypothetical protein